MPKFRITSPDGSTYEITAPEGATAEQVMEVARSQFQFKPDTGNPVDQATANMDPRDLRERNVLTSKSPEAVMRRAQLTAKTGLVDRIAQGSQDAFLGLGQTVAHMLPGQAAGRFMDEQVAKSNEEMRLGRLVRGENPYGVDVPRTIGNAATTMAALPMKPAGTMLGRAAQGAGLGAAGGVTQTVEGGDFAEEKARQVITGALAGAVATPALEVLMRGGSAAVGALRQYARSRALSAADVDAAVAQGLQAAGVNPSALSNDVRKALADEVRKATVSGADLNPQQLARFADIKAVGATPTRGAVTLDPVAITQERNLAKMGANSNVPELQALARQEAGNNAALIGRLNDLGAGGSPPAQATAGRVINALRGADEARQSTVSGLYGQAESVNALAGRAGVPLEFDGARFVDRATAALDQSGRGAFLPGNVRQVMQGLADRGPMTMQQYEQLRTILATAQRSATDGNERAAIGIVRDSLERATPNNIVTEAARLAFTRARGAHAARMQLIEDTPALKAAIEGVEPDRFVQSFITGSGATTADVNALRKAITADPEAFDMVRRTIVDSLKQRALNGASEEVGTFSQSAYNKALREIGDGKLGAFFSPQEIEQLRQVGRAASYLQVQPKGSAVNNSNTAGTALGMLDNVLGKLSNVPVVRAPVNVLAGPIRDALQARAAKNALTAFPNAAQPADPRLLQLVSPLGGLGGVVAAQQ